GGCGSRQGSSHIPGSSRAFRVGGSGRSGCGHAADFYGAFCVSGSSRRASAGGHTVGAGQGCGGFSSQACGPIGSIRVRTDMSAGVDLSEFFDTFFDEADELLTNMEKQLMDLDLDHPDPDHLNAIFRAAHSIKGGAGTFGCFEELAKTTHLLENLLDLIRHEELALRRDMID